MCSDVGIAVQASAHLSVPGDVVWDGTPPNKPVDTKINIGLNPIGFFSVRAVPSGFSSLPGGFSVNGLLTGDYGAVVYGLSDGNVREGSDFMAIAACCTSRFCVEGAAQLQHSPSHAMAVLFAGAEGDGQGATNRWLKFLDHRGPGCREFGS